MPVNELLSNRPRVRTKHCQHRKLKNKKRTENWGRRMEMSSLPGSHRDIYGSQWHGGTIIDSQECKQRNQQTQRFHPLLATA